MLMPHVVGACMVLILGVLVYGGAMWVRARRYQRRLVSIKEKVQWASIVEEYERRKTSSSRSDVEDLRARYPKPSDAQRRGPQCGGGAAVGGGSPCR